MKQLQSVLQCQKRRGRESNLWKTMERKSISRTIKIDGSETTKFLYVWFQRYTNYILFRLIFISFGETQVRNLFGVVLGFGCFLFNMFGCWEDGGFRHLNFGVLLLGPEKIRVSHESELVLIFVLGFTFLFFLEKYNRFALIFKLNLTISCKPIRI